jgi:hypothetical protein
MTDQEPSDRAPEQPEPARRPWSKPTLDIVEACDTEGPSMGFPHTDSVTGIS